MRSEIVWGVFLVQLKRKEVIPLGFQAWLREHCLLCGVTSAEDSSDSKPAWLF